MKLKFLLFVVPAITTISLLNKKDTSIEKRSDNFYYSQHEKVYVEKDLKSIFIETNIKGEEEIKNLIKTTPYAHLESVTKDDLKSRLHQPKYSNNFNYFLKLSLDSSVTQKEESILLSKLDANQNVKNTSTSFSSKNGSSFNISSNFNVKLKNSSDYKKLVAIAKKHNVEIKGENKMSPNWYTLSITNKSQYKNSLVMANVFYETKNFEYAQPQFFAPLKLAGTDPYWSSQWALRSTAENLGEKGMDINVREAWKLTKGKKSIKIAVYDGGVSDHADSEHSLLSESLSVVDVEYYREQHLALPELDSPVLTGQTLPNGSHGTAVAEIITAKHFNDFGSRGIAPKCSILPISILIGGVSTDSHAFGLNWAVFKGADVINLSWETLTMRHVFNSDIMMDALSNALKNGRNGKGTVLVISSGNLNRDLRSLNFLNKFPNIILVGGVTPSGLRKIPNDEYNIDLNSDGLVNRSDKWGANYGENLDISAPAVKIPVTIGGTGDPTFISGTSFAAPMVSATVGLMLSVNPDLKVNQVHKILMQTAKKVRTDVYNYEINDINNSRKNGGTWHEEIGHGMLNAGQAVKKAAKLATPSITSKVMKNKERIQNTISISPSTVPNSLTLNIPSIDSSSYAYISNLSGSVLKELAIVDSPLNIDVSNMKNGVYILTLYNKGEVISKKFIVKN